MEKIRADMSDLTQEKNNTIFRKRYSKNRHDLD